MVADPQDPLPESNWLWRRWLVFTGEAARAAAFGWILWALAREASVDHLFRLAVWLVILSMVDRVLYLIAPSAEQATRMLATVSAWRAGISTSVASRVTTAEGRAEVETKVGPVGGAVSPVPPPPAAAPSPTPPPATGGGAAIPPTVDLSEE